MDFRENQSIYLQIAEYVCEQILLNKWTLGNKIPSIRDTAVAMQVNPTTVQRSYEFLQQKEIIVNQRGLGFFVPEEAMERILEFRREQFIKQEMPVFFRNMYLLKMGFTQAHKLYLKFIKENFK